MPRTYKRKNTIKFNGKEYSIDKFAALTKINRSSVYTRYKQGMSAEEIVKSYYSKLRGFPLI